MTNTPENSRLDRIERILDTLATNQINEREARLAQREDLEILYQTIRLVGEGTDANTEAISRLTDQMSGLAEAQQRMETSVDQLAALMVRFVETAEADRAAIREMQAEVQQIWQYLLSQQGNGHQG